MMKILLPIDGSERSLHQVHHALQLTQQGLRASFVLVNVQERANLYEMVTVPDPAVLDEISRAAGKHALRPALALLEKAGLACESDVVTGDPAQAVLLLIEQHGCDMVIISSRGMGLWRSALEGSVALTLLQEASVPVLVVKPPAGPEVLDGGDEANGA